MVALNTFAQLNPTNLAYYDRLLLERARPLLGHMLTAQKRRLPAGNGKVAVYRRFNDLSVNATPLSPEGVTPAGDAVTRTEVTVSVQQYGNYVAYSDQLKDFSYDPVLDEFNEILAFNAAITIERVNRAELVTGTSVFYPGAIVARSNVTPTSYITSDLVRKAVTTLVVNNAPKFHGQRSDTTGQGGYYAGLIHPYVMKDYKDSLKTDTKYIEVAFKEGYYDFVMTMMDGVMWFETTEAAVFLAAGDSSANVYATLVLGKNAWGSPEIAGKGRMQMMVKALGSAGSADPLDQRGTIGWKSYQAPKILNNNFMTRLETAASMG